MRCVAIVVSIAWVAGALAGCIIPPKQNELVAKTGGRHVEFRGKIASATFCKGCGEDAPVTLTFGVPPAFVLTIPNCYAHAHSKIGDHDRVQVSNEQDHSIASEGELDITECNTREAIGKLWASFPSGVRVDVTFDTALTEPSQGSAAGAGSGSGSGS